MKHTYKFLPPKKYWLLLPLALIALLVWQRGAGLMIAHHFPLKEPQKRLALILTLFLAWTIKFLLWEQLRTPASDTSNLAQLLHTLRGRFLGALRFLKKTVIDKHGFSTPLNTLPWYLLIGPPGSGKTTLLTQSNINFILSKQRKQEGQEKSVPSSSVCDWWVTRDLVLVDVPGCYAFSPAKNTLTDALHPEEATKAASASAKPHVQLALWQSLLTLLIKYRQKNNIGAVVIALNLPELIKLSRQQQTQWFQDLRQRLLECWDKFGKLPVYFLVTKCDLLPGFSEFFNDIGSDELMQPWGIPLSGRKEHEKLLDLFTERFNALIKRLNKQLIWRLHQERSPQLRPAVKDFPLQLEFLKETLSQLIKMLSAANPDLELEGIYLTSATQENNAATSTTLFHHDLPSALDVPPSSPFVSRAYFIKHVISYLLPHTSHHIVQRFHQRKYLLPRLTYGLGFLLLCIGVFGLGVDFQRGLYQLSTVQRYLAQYQLYVQQNNAQEASVTTLTSALPLLNTLQAATQLPNRVSRLEKIETPYSSKSRQTAVGIYQRALQTLVLPQIRNEFEKYLETAADKNPEQLYAALKAYLLLRRPDTDSDSSGKQASLAQTGWIIQILGQISPTFGKNTVNKELTQPAFLRHLQNALQLKQASQLNNRLIKQARKTLNSLPDKDLAFILVKNRNNNSKDSQLNFGTNIGTPPALVSKGTMTQVPYMYTAPAFAVVMKEDLPLAAAETINGNEVLGKKFYNSDSLISNAETIAALAQELEKNYLNHYIDIWESLVDNISINLPKSLTETDAVIMNLISAHSPLLQLLQTLHANTDLEPVLNNSFKLQALNILYNQTQTQQKDSLYAIFTDLRELHQLLQQASSAAPHDKINPVLTGQQSPILRIRATAENYPEPIKNWLQTLLSVTQNYLLPESKAKVNKKVSMKETALETTQAQNLIVLPAPLSPEEADTQVLPPAPAPQKTVLAQKQPAAKEKVILAEVKEEDPEKARKAALPQKTATEKTGQPAKKEALLAKPDEPFKGSLDIKPQNQEKQGEYVRVLADKAHPLIFVQKD